MKWSKYNYIYKSPKHGTLLFNKLSGAFFDISDSEVEADILSLKENPDNYDLSQEQNRENYNMLVASGVLCEDDDEGRSTMNFVLMSNRFDVDDKSLTICPTLDCNLSCDYCFEGAYRKVGIMSKEVIEQLKEFIKREY